jgi:hypothetical protein
MVVVVVEVVERKTSRDEHSLTGTSGRSLKQVADFS